MSKHIPTVGLGLLSAALYFALADRGLMMPDEGNLFMASSRIHDGQVPYRDYYHFYGPARFYLLAGLFELFGPSFLVMRFLLAAARVLTVVLTFSVAARYMPRRYALIAAVMVMLVPGPWFKTFYQVAGLAPMLVVLVFLRCPHWRWAIACGLASGLAALFRQDAGLLTLGVGLFAAVVAPFRQDVKPAERALFGAAVLGGAAVPIAVTAILLASAGAASAALEQMFFLAPTYTAGRLESPGEMFEWAKSFLEASPFLMPVVALAIAAALWLRGFIGDRRSLPTFELFLLLGISAVSIVPGYLPARPIRLYQSWHFIWIVAAYLIWRFAAWAATRPAPAPWRFAAGVLALALPLGLAAVAMTRNETGLRATEYAGTPVHLAKSASPLVVRGETIFVTPFKARWISNVVDHVQRETEEGEPILVLPNQSMLYYFCDRPNPTRFIATYTLRYPFEVQDRNRWQDLVDDVDRSKLRLAIVSRRFMQPENEHYMRRYLLDNFRKTARFGPNLVWLRKQPGRQ